LIIGGAAALIVRNALGAMVITLIATAIMVGLQLGTRRNYAPASIDARPLGGAAAYDSSGNTGFWFDSWTIGSDYVDGAGNVVDIDQQYCARAIYSDDDFGQRPDETYADYNARTEIRYQEQQGDYKTCLRRLHARHCRVEFLRRRTPTSSLQTSTRSRGRAVRSCSSEAPGS
jgi:hypothetical protein